MSDERDFMVDVCVVITSNNRWIDEFHNKNALRDI